MNMFFQPYQRSYLILHVLPRPCRGLLKYDALVKDYWPEFGCHGKENITVEMLLSHQGGLEKAQFKTTFEDIGDHRKMSKLLSDMTPSWPPGVGGLP